MTVSDGSKPTLIAPLLPDWTECAFHLVTVRVLLKVYGFGRAYRIYHRHVVKSFQDKQRLCAMTNSDMCSQAADRIASVAALLPMRLRCLEQAMALDAVLRRRGVASSLRLGVSPHKFTAHAWVEVFGRPIGQTDEIVGRLAILPVIPQ